MIIDLHNHTFPKSSCSYLEPAELVQRAKDLGLDGICLTEHNRVWPSADVESLERQYDFLVLRGMEVSTEFGHVLVFGLEEDVRGFVYVKRLREIVTAVGGVMILAHPFRNRFGDPTRSEMAPIFDAFELLNGGDFTLSMPVGRYPEPEPGLKATGGSDAHALREIGTCATEFDAEIGNENDLIEALKGNGYRPKRLR